MNSKRHCGHLAQELHEVNRSTKIALWWLRHYEDIIGFWKGFSWVATIGVFFYVIVGYLDIGVAIPGLFIVGVVANGGIYFSIRAISSHLKHMQEGPEKEEAHALMMKIIKKRIYQEA